MRIKCIIEVASSKKIDRGGARIAFNFLDPAGIADGFLRGVEIFDPFQK